MELKYGHSQVSLDLSYFPNAIEITSDPVEKNIIDLKRQLKPAVEKLKNLMQNKDINNIAIILEDRTRYNPEYPEILSLLISCIEKYSHAIIFLVPAYGTHKPHSQENNIRLYGQQNLNRLTIIQHNSLDDNQLTEVGKFKTGKSFRINSTVANANLRIVIGSVAPHAFAGFTGGRKAILPGVAAYDSIKENHSNVKNRNAQLALLNLNPIHENMVEAADMIVVDLSIQLVRNAGNILSGVFTGSLKESFASAVEHCKKINSITLEKQADIVLISAGGSPKDDSLYLGQRSIAIASKIVKPGGTIILFGEFKNGIGNKIFEDWLSRPHKEVLELEPEQIDIGIHSAYLFLKNKTGINLLFYTSLSDSQCAEYRFQKLQNLNDVTHYLKNNFSKEALIYVIGDSTNTFYEIEN
jgi:lactate racemase